MFRIGKKLVAIVLVFLMLMIVITSCNTNEETNYSAKEIAGLILDLYQDEELPEFAKYYSKVGEDSENYLEPKQAGQLITGNYEEIAEMEEISEYAFIIPTGHHAFEISVLKTKDVQNIDTAKQLLEKRLEQKNDPNIRLYTPDAVPLIENAEIHVKNDFAILLATTDNDKGKKMFDDILAGKVSLLETETPNIIVEKYSRNDMYLIGGSCEDGSVITVTGGAREIVSNSDYGYFLVEVPILQGNNTLTLTAKVDGKDASEKLEYEVSPQEGINIFEDKAELATIVGADYQNVFYGNVPYFTGENLLNDTQINDIKELIQNRFSKLKDSGLKDTEIIYMIAPSPMNIYSELMPPEYNQNTENNLLKQFSKAATEAGAVVLDLTDVMMENKNGEYKIYHKTDSHWTDYGALLGYNKLMEHIGKKFPAAKPRPVTDFNVYNKEMYLGDIFVMLELETNSLRETSSFVDLNFEAPGVSDTIYTGENLCPNHDVNGYSHSTGNDKIKDLPTAYIIRDSYGGVIYPYLTDRFSWADWGAWRDFANPLNLYDIEIKNPDYIIYIISERNIENILYQQDN